MEVQIEAQENSRTASAPQARPVPRPRSLAGLWATVLEWNRANGIIPFGARPYAPALVWLLAMGGAVTFAPYSRAAAVAMAAAGVVFAIGGLRGALPVRAITALAMLPGAAASAPNWAWVVSGGVVALVVSARGGPVVLRSHDLQRHLDWCRRRQEKAHVLVITFSLREVPHPVRILDSFRTTDSIALHYSHGSCELQAVLDDTGFSREGVERRILDDNPGANFRFGWTSFPENGVTLASLIESARADQLEPSRELHPLRELTAESYA